MFFFMVTDVPKVTDVDLSLWGFRLSYYIDAFVIPHFAQSIPPPDDRWMTDQSPKKLAPREGSVTLILTVYFIDLVGRKFEV